MFGWALHTGGSQAAIVNWLVVGGCSTTVGVVLAEIAVAFPSSGGVYHWTRGLGGIRWGPSLAWQAAWWNWVGWLVLEIERLESSPER